MTTQITPFRSSVDPAQLQRHLDFALEGMMPGLVEKLTALLKPSLPDQYVLDAVSRSLKNELLILVKREFVQDFIQANSASAERRAMLTHLLAAAAVQVPTDSYFLKDEEVLTSEQAAKLLKLSRTHVNGLLDSSAIDSFRTEGGHRRVLRKAVMDYRMKQQVQQQEALEEMSRLSADLGLYGTINEIAGDA